MQNINVQHKTTALTIQNTQKHEPSLAKIITFFNSRFTKEEKLCK